MRRVSIKGVLIGWLAATAAIFIFVFLVLIARFTLVARNGHNLLHFNSAVRATVVMSGLLFSVMGGYFSAKIARHDEVLNGALISFACVFVSIIQILTGHTTVLAVFLTLIATPACAALGGYLRLRQKHAGTRLLELRS